MHIALVGLPNVGKSTLFNALTKSGKAQAANFPFCTINPNVGTIPLKDQRLDKIAAVAKTAKILYETIEFVDVAGLVKGASQGEGLGNQFLSHIRNCDAVAMVLRFFQDGNITHVSGKVDPKDDRETIETELILADLQSAEKSLEKAKKNAKSGKAEEIARAKGLEKIVAVLGEGQRASTAELEEDEEEATRDLLFLTTKPFLYVANVGDDAIASFDIEEAKHKAGLQPDDILIPICAKIEEELISLDPEEQVMFLEDLQIKEDGLQLLARTAHQLLGLICYFTAGEKEARAWTIHDGFTAPQAAGKIHGDFEKGFISVDVVKTPDFLEHGGWKGCREKGLVHNEGKTYVMHDGDICLFKFNV